MNGRRLLLALAAIVLAATIPILIVLLRRPPDPKLEDDGEVPPFSLVDERGQTFTQDALRGHPTIVSFIFTRCDLSCPVTSMKMEQLQEKTFDRGDRIKLLSFTVDPEYDTPPILAAYAKHYHADAERWRFVTGPKPAIQKLIEGPFMGTMDRLPDHNGVTNIAHLNRLLLIDANLHIRGTYDLNDQNRLEALNRDARFLARTQR